MSQTHLVSIILTSFNHGEFIAEAIDSVLDQSYGNFELIIWDDCSSDNSWDIIQSFTDDRIKAFRNETQSRAVYGINKAISDVAIGEYIAIHHSDDVWHKDKLAKQVQVLNADDDIKAVFTSVYPIDESGGELSDKDHYYYSIFKQRNRTQQEWLHDLLIYGNCLCHPSVIVRKSTYDTVGLYKYGLTQLGDYEMWLRVLMHGNIHVIADRLTSFRVLMGGGNSSSNPIGLKRLEVDHFNIFSDIFNEKNLAQIKRAFNIAGDYSNVLTHLSNYILQHCKGKGIRLWALRLKFEHLTFDDSLDYIAYNTESDIFNDYSNYELQCSNRLIHEQLNSKKAELTLVKSKLDSTKSELLSMKKSFLWRFITQIKAIINFIIKAKVR